MDKSDWAIILLSIMVLGLFVYTALNGKVSDKHQIELGEHYCSQNNDILMDYSCGDINCFYYCNNTMIKGDGTVYWRREG